jgi:hypothetical protein
MVTTILIALALVAPQAAVPASHASDKHRAPVPVYVFTNRAETESQPSEDEQGRLDTVRDFRDALHRRSEITLVDSADEAKVTVEVIGRERREGGEGGFGGKTMTNFGDCIVRLRVKADGKETEIKGMAPGYWSRAAKDAAERFVKWIQRYRDR